MLELRLGISRGLTAVFTASYAIAVLGVVLGCPGWLAAGVVPVLAWDGVRVLRMHALRSAPRAIRNVTRERSGQWILRCGDGPRVVCTLRPGGSFCHPWLVILALRAGHRGRYVLIARDAVAAEPFRELRAGLRLKE